MCATVIDNIVRVSNDKLAGFAYKRADIGRKANAALGIPKSDDLFYQDVFDAAEKENISLWATCFPLK